MEECSQEWLAATQFIAGLAGQNIDDRNRPFIEKSPQFVTLTARALRIKKQYKIPDSVWELLLGDMLDWIICVANSRVDEPEQAPPEDPDLT
jgi:hypothetical protein